MRYPPASTVVTAASLPRTWLMTDARNDAALEPIIRALPSGCGIIFRHYHLDADARQARFTTVRQWARRKGHMLLLADGAERARRWGADGVHGRQWLSAGNSDLIQSAPVHNRREIAHANRNRADIFFLSPVFPTSSHPGAPGLPHMQTRRLARLCNGPVILLGGMSDARFRQMRHVGAHGWAAIDAFMR